MVFLQMLTEVPIRQWTLQDVLMIGGLIANFGALIGAGMLTVYRLGRVEKTGERTEEAFDKYRLDVEARLVTVEKDAVAANKRLDARGPQMDWQSFMRLIENMVSAQNSRDSKMDRILEILAERSR